jgi:Mn2+/Fe2+ NRAMP family transporter
MAGLMMLASKKEVMGTFTSGPKTRWFGWGGVGVMGFAVLMMFRDVLGQFF